MINPAFTPDCFKIMTLFSVSPGSRHNRNEIKEKIGLNNVPLDNALFRLLNSSILKKEGNFYSVNFENEEGKKIIAMCSSQYKEMREMPFNVYCLLMDLTDNLSRMKGIEVHLFGSFAKLIYNVDSDVDIAIVHSKNISKDPIDSFVSRLEVVYGKNIEMHYFGKKLFYNNKKDAIVKSILKDGIRLL